MQQSAPIKSVNLIGIHLYIVPCGFTNFRKNMKCFMYETLLLIIIFSLKTKIESH